jgi:beta-xylosidase
MMISLSKRLVWLLLLAPMVAVGQAGNLAPKPLFRDPVHDGAADPTLIYNVAKKQWWMFYTNRRADEAADNPKDVAWLHGTRIGIAVSSDGGANWKYRGTAEIPYGKADYTHWAPDIVRVGGTYHMFLTIVPGTFHDWNASREIVHLTSPDLEKWTFVSKLPLSSDRTIDPSLFQLPDGTWRMWYKDERDGSHIHYADSADLTTWKDVGVAIGDRNSEGPKIFRWHDKYWMIVDVWKGVAVFHSDDLVKWVPQAAKLLDVPGKAATDRSVGHHVDVVVHGDRAFLFYFTHQMGADEVATLPHSADRTVLQVVELGFRDGALTADRDAPTHVALGP